MKKKINENIAGVAHTSNLKNKKGIIISFLIGVILASSITVYAYGYRASDISYTKPGTETTINVSEALNDLYNKNKKIKIIKIGDYNSLEDREVDIKSIMPNYYPNLKVDNFVIMNAKMGCTNSNPVDSNNNIIGSYDEKDGKLKLNKCWIRDRNWYMWIDYTIGCIMGEVEVVDSI